MKKRYIVAGVALSMAIVGGVGSAVTMTTAIPKLDRYIVERRASLLSNKEIFNSSDKINQLNLGNLSLAYNTEVNIKKSTDNKVKVTATCINDKNYYDVNIKDGVLSVNIDENKKLDSNALFDNGMYLGDDRKIHFLGQKYSIFSAPKELIVEQLDKMALSGMRINSDFTEGMESESNRLYKLNIEIPESVNLTFNPSMKEGSIIPAKINIEDGLIKDTVSSNSLYIMDMIKYNGNIKNFKLDMSRYSGNKISLDNLVTSLKIEKMEVNLNPGNYFVGDIDNKKIASEVVFNFAGNKKSLNEDDDMYEIYSSEKKIVEHLVDRIKYPNSDDSYEDDDSNIDSRIDSLEKQSNKIAREKRLIELFDKEINKAKNHEDSDYGEIERDFYNSCDASINIYNNMADKISINAGESNIRLQLNKDLNPSLDIKTKDGIDLRYYLVDKVTSDKIVKKDSLKEYKGTLYDYIKKIEPSYKENRATTNPAISVNAKSLRLIEKVDENN